MNYLDNLAARIRAAVPADKLPDDDTRALFRTYAVLLLAKGDAVDASDVHNAWSAWMLDRDPTHESLVPFDELPADASRQDEPYLAAIRHAARELEAARGAS